MTGGRAMGRKFRVTALLALAVAATSLGGCASALVDNQMPVGIGAGVNTLKRSPCACVLLPNLARAA